MRRLPSLLWFLPILLLARPARACKCDISLSACNEVGASNLVFIGTVESIEPAFLSRSNQRDGAPLQRLNDAYAEARQRHSPATLRQLKDTLLKVAPGLPDDEKAQVEAAKTPADVMSLFNAAADRGLKVRFKVRTLFKHEDDDDRGADGKAKNREEKDEDFFEVSTPFGDCGFDFQLGETYLVYANAEEGSDSFFTGSCTRTRRLTDAGDDLAYLYFYKDHPEESSRLEGFATTDARYQIDFNQLHNPDAITSPAAGAVIEVQSDGVSSAKVKRDAPADKNGRFLFDGLPGGDYVISALASGYPSTTQLPAGPQRLHIAAKSCARQILLLRKSD
jgi:hypothetical protein